MFNSASCKGRLLMALLCLIGWAGLLAATAPPASAQFKAWVMAKLPDRPWGLGIDSKGSIYTSLPLTGEVVRKPKTSIRSCSMSGGSGLALFATVSTRRCPWSGPLRDPFAALFSGPASKRDSRL